MRLHAGVGPDLEDGALNFLEALEDGFADMIVLADFLNAWAVGLVFVIGEEDASELASVDEGDEDALAHGQPGVGVHDELADLLADGGFSGGIGERVAAQVKDPKDFVVFLFENPFVEEVIDDLFAQLVGIAGEVGEDGTEALDLALDQFAQAEVFGTGLDGSGILDVDGIVGDLDAVGAGEVGEDGTGEPVVEGAVGEGAELAGFVVEGEEEELFGEGERYHGDELRRYGAGGQWFFPQPGEPAHSGRCMGGFPVTGRFSKRIDRMPERHIQISCGF